MKGLIRFLQEFLKNKGLFVFSSILIEKIVGLINTIVVVRLISEEDFGLVTIIASLFSIFVTLNGFGAIQGVLRYGALEKEEVGKHALSRYFFKEGFKRQIILLVLFLLASLFYEIKYTSIWVIILFFAIRLIGYYIFSFIVTYNRIQNRNDRFAKLTIFIHLVGLALAIGLTYQFGLLGYLIGLALTPWLSLFFIPKDLLNKVSFRFEHYDIKGFWSYSLNSAFAYFLSEILFMLDVFLIGLMLNENEVAKYKLAIILPMNLKFISAIFIQTDFPKLVENSKDKSYLKFYITNYYKLFIPLSFLLLIVGFFIKDWILPFVFGKTYEENGWIFFMILFAVVCNMCFRNLYGNLLSAVGMAKKNTQIAIVSIFLMLVLGFILIPSYGLLGAAISLTITFVSMGLWSGYVFNNYLKR